MPRSPRATRSRRAWAGTSVLDSVGYMVAAAAQCTSMPAWSRCSTGPAARKRKPKPKRTAASTSSGEAMPSSMRAKASRDSACCMRLARKPGLSFFTSTGTLPQPRMKPCSHWPRAGSLRSPSTTSTSGTRWAGMKKCRPSMRCAVGRPLAMALMGKPELLLASTASAGACASSSANSACLASSRSVMHSTTRATPSQATSSSAAQTETWDAHRAKPAVASSMAMCCSSSSRRAAPGSTTVTRAPPRARTTATSAPMVPPPTTTVRALRGELLCMLSPADFMDLRRSLGSRH